MSNLYRKLQWRALRPNGDNIQPYKIACLAHAGWYSIYLPRRDGRL